MSDERRQATAEALPSWRPPFCAHEIENLECPKCGEEAVCVREKETYFDSDACEAYCADCHAELEVQVSVAVTFSDVSVAYDDEETGA